MYMCMCMCICICVCECVYFYVCTFEIVNLYCIEYIYLFCSLVS